MNTEKHYHLSFIGGGLSCSYTLVHFINLAEKNYKKNRYEILVIDKNKEFWTGIPYGMRSGFVSLTITSLKEFLPKDELEIFIKWLKRNIKRLISNAPGIESDRFPSWYLCNLEAIEMDQWENIFIPRYLFGIYLAERMNNLLEAADKRGIVKYDLVSAEVTNIEKLDTGYAIMATAKDGPLLFKTNLVVLAMGSPPKKKLNNLGNNSSAPLFVEDMYEPHLQHNMEQISKRLQSSSSKTKNVLILGSNASALEIIYNLHNAVNLNLVGKFYILSPDGVFPHKIKEHSVNDYQPAHLTRLKGQPSYTSAEILEAVKLDTKLAQKENLSASDIYQAVANAVVELMNKLSYDEQKKFVCNDGVEIGKFQRRAGGEYLAVVDDLLRQSKIEFIKGRYVNLVRKVEHQFSLEYLDGTTHQSTIFRVPFDIIINCIGFQELVNSSSELIRNLIQQRICVVNGSKRGFEVNENFECSKDFFVIGPLLAGNLNDKLRVWHAESCSRIFLLSRQLAEALIHAMS